MISRIGINERASPGPVVSSPRLKLAHSEASLPGGCRENTIASSSAMRLTEVWPVNVADDHGGVIGTVGAKRPCKSSGAMYCVNGRGIDPEGCGSTATAAMLMAKEIVAAMTASARQRTCSSAMPKSGMRGTR